MSDAKRCDRCGEFYTLDISDKKDDVAGIALLDKYGRSGEKLDLCQKCRKELMEWLKPEKKDFAVKKEMMDDGKYKITTENKVIIADYPLTNMDCIQIFDREEYEKGEE